MPPFAEAWCTCFHLPNKCSNLKLSTKGESFSMRSFIRWLFCVSVYTALRFTQKAFTVEIGLFSYLSAASSIAELKEIRTEETSDIVSVIVYTLNMISSNRNFQLLFQSILSLHCQLPWIIIFFGPLLVQNYFAGE